MQKGYYCKEIGMTQIFAENGLLIPVTVLEAGPCVVTQRRQLKRRIRSYPGWFRRSKG